MGQLLFYEICTPLASAEEEIAQRSDRMIEEHTGPSKTHHSADFLAHFGVVAVNRADLATTLFIAKFAAIEPLVSVGHKGLAIGA